MPNTPPATMNPAASSRSRWRRSMITARRLNMALLRVRWGWVEIGDQFGELGGCVLWHERAGVGQCHEDGVGQIPYEPVGMPERKHLVVLAPHHQHATVIGLELFDG